jgi:hypothetical protein
VIEWDDWYQSQKGGRDVRRALAAFKEEQRAFYEEWREAEKDPVKREALQSASSWDSGQ